MHETEQLQESLLGWFIRSLGPFYLILLPVSALICFLLVLGILMRGKGPLAAAALILVVHLPVMIGVFAAFQGAIASFRVIASSPMTPKPSDIAEGVSVSLVAFTVSMLLVAPSYLAATIGACVRCFRERSSNTSP